MTDYTELIHDLRYCAYGNRPDCSICEYEANRNNCKDRIMLDAADAIEALQAEVEQCTLFNTDLLNMREMSKEEADEILEYIRTTPVGPIEPMQIEQLPKRGEWIETEEKEWGIYPFKKHTCSVCDCKIDHIFMLACMDYFDDRDTVFHYCPNCGAKMDGEVEHG